MTDFKSQNIPLFKRDIVEYLVLATTYFRDQLPSNYRQRYSV